MPLIERLTGLDWDAGMGVRIDIDEFCDALQEIAATGGTGVSESMVTDWFALTTADVEDLRIFFRRLTDLDDAHDYPDLQTGVDRANEVRAVLRLASISFFGLSSVAFVKTRLLPGQIWAASVGAPDGLHAAGAIASLEAFGTAVVWAGVRGQGITSEEALGEPALTRQLAPVGIASEEAFGTPMLVRRDVTPEGIPSEETFGEPTLWGEPPI